MNPERENGGSHSNESKNILGYDFFTRPLCDPENFPILVWLRGDEAYCDEFSLSADAVMEILGIKRSRLTQIAGRELRVARRRDGRYIKPMFRPIDVEEYKQNSRAPMSHLKSSEVFQQTFEGVWEQFDAKLTYEIEAVKNLQKKHFEDVLQETRKILDEKFSENSKATGIIIAEKFLAFEQLQKNFQEQWQICFTNQIDKLKPKEIPKQIFRTASIRNFSLKKEQHLPNTKVQRAAKQIFRRDHNA